MSEQPRCPACDIPICEQDKLRLRLMRLDNVSHMTSHGAPDELRTELETSAWAAGFNAGVAACRDATKGDD